MLFCTYLLFQLNGEVEKSSAVNGDAPNTNGDVKAEDKEAASGDAPADEDKNDLEETKENGTDIAESSKEGGKKTSMKDKVKNILEGNQIDMAAEIARNSVEKHDQNK